MVVPRLLLTGPLYRGFRIVILERTSRTMTAIGTIRIARGTPDPLIRSSTGEPGLSLWHFLAPDPGLPGHAINAPTLHLPRHSGPVPARFSLALRPRFRAPNYPLFESKKSSPAALTGGRSGRFGTHLG